MLPDLGSDHYPLLFTISGAQSPTPEESPQNLRFNTNLADWDHFQSQLVRLTANTAPSPTTADALEQAAQALTSHILVAAKTSIPTKRTGAIPKPWWTPELKAFRQQMLRNQRLHKASPSPSTVRQYLEAKNRYFQEIKLAKRTHWNTFLTHNDSKSIFKAMSYTKDYRVERIPSIQSDGTGLAETFQTKAEAFRTTLFPTPPATPAPSWDDYTASDVWDWPELTSTELEQACTAKLKGTTPGPDGITQDIIRCAYQAIPQAFLSVYKGLIDTGYHPLCWKQATGAILKKPKKPDYSLPKAYRVISLLNCLGKVSERILAKRLAYLAETTGLLHESQIGGRLKKSAIDAALLLTNEVETNKRLGLKTTTLFLDVKGAFDHVAKNQLLSTLQQLRLPLSLIYWVQSFLTSRTLRLSFDGQTEQFTDIETGIPQGSPISPILFLIYIRNLFASKAVQFISYIDDISLTTASNSLKRNVQVLQREAASLYGLAATNSIQFDLAKTELMHFTTSKQAKRQTLRLPDQTIVSPSPLVKWLGIHFDPNLTFKQHVALRTAQATSAFHRMARIANSERGLSPFALRQLYLACVASIADYGSIIWWRGQVGLANKLQVLQNLGLRKILGVFRTSPIPTMEAEAGLVPPSIRLNASVRQYAFRLFVLPESHPVRKTSEIGTSPELDQTTASSKHRHTQLERITGSIQRFHGDYTDFETVEHYYFAPWNKHTPFRVNIPSLSKEDAAIQHNNILDTFRGTNTTTIYTDASSVSNGKGIGIGLIAKSFSENGTNSRTTHETTLNIGPGQLVYNGELEGVTLAIEHASRIAIAGQSFHVYSDNQAGLYRLRTPSDKPGQDCQIRAIAAAKQIVAKGASITLNWVPGHTDIEGNEDADRLAKRATKEQPSTERTSLAMLGLWIKKTKMNEWNTALEKHSRKARAKRLRNPNPSSYMAIFPWKPATRVQIPTPTNRTTASAYYQLKIGHGYFKAYLFKRNRSADYRCICGREETPEHLLLYCPEYGDLRRALQEQLPCTTTITLPLLLHTNIGIEKTLPFLNTTGIATRKWHLERHEERRGEIGGGDSQRGGGSSIRYR